ncbi:glycosyltransferase family 2 protein [Hathewaya limosa]|uniref:Cellulose synthase/poly-beta-1,6-N-acetylglucosamine synthase-like glycosyltransferase n=1 Tax=Hathewaya limosa TaxID=1536 RepID=A0ABU0JRT7_HATLI|nr:glycosyltransferase [Hathewaya limosa]MDQ0479140.1 cellulose synthase/poly-beta-1,6-N-acetylglucosamine synthase-like glycosyltransferase [Hathewaya limosa]
MDLSKIVLILDNMVLIYSVVMFSVFFIFVIASALSFNKYRQTEKFIYNFNLNKSKEYIPISLLVPAYNEEVTICNTIDSLISLDYKEYEIIVISDGSKDNTVELVKRKYNLKYIYKPMKNNIATNEVVAVYKGSKDDISIILIDKINGGKADALNVGINYSSYPIFVAIDADSILQKDSLEKIVIPFMQNEKTIAVGGNIKISNFTTIKDGTVIKVEKPKGLIVPFQIIEYLRAFLTNRMVWGIFNMNLIISGAFGAFNKQVVMEIGGYKSDTVGEDMELVMRMHKHFLRNKEEYYIGFTPDANCYTQAPNTLKGLKTQRKRWQIGLIHSMSIHKSMFLNSKWFLAKSYFLLFELITPIVELFGVGVITLAFLCKIINLQLLFQYYFIIIVYGLSISIASILFELYAFKESVKANVILKLILVSIIEGIGYRQLISLYRVSAFIGYNKNKHKWGSIKRTKQN